MNSILYVYDYHNLKQIQSDYPKCKFLSIGNLLYLSDTTDGLADLDETEINDSFIDITNLVKDGNFFKIFTERYLRTICDQFENINFCLHTNYLDQFINNFPYFFDESEINYKYRDNEDVQESKITEKQIHTHPPIDLYIYKDIATINKLFNENNAISLSNLINECEGILLKYDFNNINCIFEEKEIQYVDLSSIIATLNMRRDLIFNIEVLIHHISSVHSIKYSLKSDLVLEACELFPLLFGSEHYFDENTDKDIGDKEDLHLIDMNKSNIIANQISDKLQGHTVFKDDFKHNLLKFSFLNKMGERNILSIFLCGDSGIGKTEFAKIASKIMFPNEPLIKINFGNYSTEGVLNSLIGSPLGYYGSLEGGELINKIKKSKSKIILIDEFEKATPSVFNFFYELLEDGKFTDRHGLEHDLCGYIIIFTSNMTQKQYDRQIPNSLKSRFDMVYNFIDLAIEDKNTYILNTTRTLVDKLHEEYGILVGIDIIDSHLNELVKYKNLRDIKRKVEDIVFSEFFKHYKDSDKILAPEIHNVL